MTLLSPQFATCKTAEEALASLAGPMRAREVAPTEMPAEARDLLVHHGHMTQVLERLHRSPVSLTVLKDQLADGVYWRKILLHAPPPQLVEYGIVRIFLQYVPKAAADEILSRRLPLGRILISHHVLRRVDPRWYVQLSSQELVDHFGIAPPAPLAYGRVAIIHCNHQPAIELLEVVT